MNRAPLFLLYLNVLVVATCGLIYELLAGTLASYVLGDSVTQFSTIIGAYLFAMGIGSWLSRFVERGLAARFVMIEIMVGLVGKPEVKTVADAAEQRLRRACESLGGSTTQAT